MRTRHQDGFTTVRTEGAILPRDLLARIAAGDKDLGGLSPDDYHLSGERLNEATNRAWNRLQGAWAAFRRETDALRPEVCLRASAVAPGAAASAAGQGAAAASAASAAAGGRSSTLDPGTSPTRERWLLPLFQELGYGRLQTAKAAEIDGRTYAVSHAWVAAGGDGPIQLVPIHLVGLNIDLDKRTPGVAGAAQAGPHSLLQEYLNRSDEHLWGFVSNGLRLRILRDNRSLTRQAYVEFDLEAMMNGEAYSDFALLYLLCHQSRVEGERPEECWLEKWSRAAEQQGTRALDQLRKGVEEAIGSLGAGFLAHPENAELRRRLQEGELSPHDYYRDLLRLVYRLLFLFVAEDRGLLLDPAASRAAKDLYNRFYSTVRLRRLAEQRRGGRHSDLYRGLRLVMEKLGQEGGCPELALPALGGFLFSEEGRGAAADAGGAGLGALDIQNRELLAAVRALAFTTDGRVRRAVDYRNLGSEELGSVYEALLELHPEVNVPARTFALTSGGGSERKTTGSYYTPSSLIQCLLDSALDPVVDEAVRGPEPEAALLSLRICDPACGSGHFLVAAAHRLAKRLAAVRTGDEEPSPEAQRGALRDVIGHCLYGVDVNPMAVELCKVSLWMEAVEPGRPLSFLDHRILCGNSLLGATPALLADGIPDEAFQALEGDDKKVVSELKKQNRQQRKGQETLFAGTSTTIDVTGLARTLAELDGLDDDSLSAVRAKEERYRSLGRSEEYRHAKLAADAWCAAFVCRKVPGTLAVTQDVYTRLVRDPRTVPEELRAEIERLADEYRFFHWHLAFPEVLAPAANDVIPADGPGWSGGFDVVLGNPPFVNAIEGAIGERTKVPMRLLYPELGGTADQAFQFLSLGTLTVSGGGSVGLVQPRSVLNAPACERLRSSLMERLPPRRVFIGRRPDLFSGAAVFVCLLCLGRGDGLALVSTDDEPGAAVWHRVSLRTTNWWGEILGAQEGLELGASRDAIPLSARFEITASMTAADAYDLIPFVIDERDGSGPKLVTTGLIDPGVCLWGSDMCRYLKSDYLCPRVPTSDSMTASIRRRLQKSRRPKIIVAGLSKRVECFLDTRGEFVGAVSTFSIYHPKDDVGALEDLCGALLSEDASVRFRLELGGNAMGGGNITMKKQFLESFPIAEEN